MCQGGEVRASLQWAVRAEPTRADDKKPDALWVIAGKAGWLRCSSVEDPQGIFSIITPCHPTFLTKTEPLGIFRQALSEITRNTYQKRMECGDGNLCRPGKLILSKESGWLA